jgi:hypothetical protein
MLINNVKQSFITKVNEQCLFTNNTGDAHRYVKIEWTPHGQR